MSISLRAWKLLWPLRAWLHKGLDVGDYFPNFTLSDEAGQGYALSDNPAGKLTALWLTNLCEDCRSKVPLLEELRREAGRTFRVLAISLLGDERTLPRQVSAQCGFPILLDPEDIVAHRLGLTHPPQTCPHALVYAEDLEMTAHCDKLIKQLTDLADEYQALSKLHEKKAGAYGVPLLK